MLYNITLKYYSDPHLGYYYNVKKMTLF